MAVNNLPAFSSPLIYGRRVPANGDLLSTGPRYMVDHLIGQNRDITAPLNLGIVHLVTVDLDLACDRGQKIFHRRKAIDAVLLRRIEVGNVRGVSLKKPLRIAFAPAVKRGTLQRYDRFGLVIICGACG